MLASSPLRLSGRCTIAEVETQRDVVSAAMTATDDTVLIDLASLEHADVTLVQLVVAAQAEARRRGRAFAISAWSPAASETFVRAGLDPTRFAPLAATGA